MTVALRDARRQCGMGGRRDFVVIPDLVYADDTVLLGSSAVEVQKYLDHITAVGRSYGLELNFLKTILLRVRGEYDIYGADGKPLQVKSQAVFLGGLLSTDGSVGAELSRRIGEGRDCFHTLARVWRHANISKTRKMQIFEACIVSKILYGLETVWLQGSAPKARCFLL